MSREQITDNPFDLIKASDYSDAEILDHWVDISDDHGGLVNVLKPRLVMPMLLLGGKGSGKTHLMRYCSAPVQAARHGSSLYSAVDAEGYMGIYMRAEGLNTLKFSGKGQTEEVWSSVFSMYFELWVVTNLVNTIADFLASKGGQFDELAFAKDVASLFDTDVSAEFSSIPTFLEYLTRQRKAIDFAVNNAAMSRELAGITITFSPGSLAFGIPKVAAAIEPTIKETMFVYLIDEAENFTEGQQKFLNTLIRYRSGNATIKVGARLYGIRTYNTLGSGEPIKRDAEYERVELDSFIRDHDAEYRNFVSKLVQKRLERFRFPGVKSTDDLGSYFVEISQENYYQEVALDLVKSIDIAGSERPYFRKLRSHIRTAFKATDEQASTVIRALRMDDHPLFEKAAVFMVYREWPKAYDGFAELTARITQQGASLLKGSRANAPDFIQILDHFSSDLLAQLYRDCRRKIPYAGFKTLVHLSQGIPRNFLCLLKHIYRRSLFSGERPFAGGVISIASQTEGVIDGAAWFWEDAQPDNYGVEVREAIEALAVLFRTIRYSERPSECDLCTFSVDLDKLTNNSRLVLDMAENWSYLIRIRGGAKNKNTQSVDAKFQLGPMLAPKWGVSEHRRGMVELKPDLANALFDYERRDALTALFKARVSSMLAPTFGGSLAQETLL